MNGIFFYIGLGAGLAAACGLRPFLPAAARRRARLGRRARRQLRPRQLSTSCSQAGGCSRSRSRSSPAYALQLLLGWRRRSSPASAAARDPLAAALAGLAYGAGALLFAGTLAAHGDASWPGLIGGFAVVALAQRASGPVIARRPRAAARPRRARGADASTSTRPRCSRGARRAAAPARLRRVALLALVAAARSRARAGEKYAGLRILRR